MAHDDDAQVLVVGHEPDFSQVVGDLTGGRIRLKKGGVAAVGVERGGGRAARAAAPARAPETRLAARCREILAARFRETRLAARFLGVRRASRAPGSIAWWAAELPACGGPAHRSAASITASATSRAVVQRGREHVLARVVRAAAARAEPVDATPGSPPRGGSRRWRRRARCRPPGARARRPRRRAAADRRARVHPGPQPDELGLQRSRRRPPRASRDCASRMRRSSSARRSQKSSPRPGTTLKASPLCSTVGTAVSRCGPAGVVGGGHGLGGGRQREQRVAPAVGRRPRVRGAARARSRGSCRPPCAAPPRLGPVRGRSPASKHRQASQPAKRSTCTNAAVRHSSSQTSSSTASA